jgi:hypothetical protein
MKVNELPQPEQDRLRELMPGEWDVIASLDTDELILYAEAKLEDTGPSTRAPATPLRAGTGDQRACGAAGGQSW